jgi:hypothetical protein
MQLGDATQQAWNGVYFVLNSEQSRGRTEFNRAAQRGGAAARPAQRPLRRSSQPAGAGPDRSILPFSVPRDPTGRALEAAAGGGFFGLSPSLTGIIQTDPAVLFGTIGYNLNFAKKVNARIPPVRIDRHARFLRCRTAASGKLLIYVTMRLIYRNAG